MLNLELASLRHKLIIVLHSPYMRHEHYKQNPINGRVRMREIGRGSWPSTLNPMLVVSIFFSIIPI